MDHLRNLACKYRLPFLVGFRNQHLPHKGFQYTGYQHIFHPPEGHQTILWDSDRLLYCHLFHIPRFVHMCLDPCKDLTDSFDMDLLDNLAGSCKPLFLLFRHIWRYCHMDCLRMVFDSLVLAAVFEEELRV
jgi:hypothetical protein